MSCKIKISEVKLKTSLTMSSVNGIKGLPFLTETFTKYKSTEKRFGSQASLKNSLLFYEGRSEAFKK